jgi:hypothetical protein
LPQKHNSWWTISKTPYNQLKLHILFIGCDIALYVKFGIILILFAWGFNSRFNSAAETLFLVNHMKLPQNQLKIHIISIHVDIATRIKFGLILISFAWGFYCTFNFAANWSYMGFGYLDIIEGPINWDLLFFLVS